ncbi:hypothetical protein RF11_04750 [Thelohanellus kitauei]|uniref:ISXO2-like transposase domain-containing protein n=1 Tax=Thelohanellus kitauei TaxID=669202 RepID=A0A0C2N473_THEKT|nr:hypothetical protein RF11_04750 [Thelohanellus kitauei]
MVLKKVERFDYLRLREGIKILLPTSRDNVIAGSIVWSNEWAPYCSIGSERDEILHESVNHSVEFASYDGVHIQNIEHMRSSIKKLFIFSTINTIIEIIGKSSSRIYVTENVQSNNQ